MARKHRLIKKVLVIGIGKVGSLVATLLDESGFNVTGLDVAPRDDLCIEVKGVDISDSEAVCAHIKKTDAVVSCLPFHLNLPIAHMAHKHGVHYFDLTEDVATTDAIKELARSATAVMAPQCGLAPGFISIVGAHLANEFDTIRSIKLRVGALPQHPSGMLGYAFNWSPEGVVNEYLNDCQVIQDGKIKKVPAMQNQETIIIDGHRLEACSTSGGLGTMCETFAGKVESLDYKTLRYPGHFDLMRFLFHELHMKNDPLSAAEILVNAKPPVSEDVVYIHASAEGYKERPRVMNPGLYREEFVRAYLPKYVKGKAWRAISWTTAASVTATVELVSGGKLIKQGFLKQEDIKLADFLNTIAGKMYSTE